jgi:hypothetical protein
MAKRSTKAPATRPTKASVQRTLKQSIVAPLRKAFGGDERIHIKESGPSWVNSPRPPRPRADVSVKKGITVVVQRPTKK